MDVSGRILRIWMPAIHAGMTMLFIFMLWGERNIMNHFVVDASPQETQKSGFSKDV
jgi:hypothetical protein